MREQPLLTCSECGTPTQTPAHREYIRRRLPDHMATLLERELCPSCARQRADRPKVEWTATVKPLSTRRRGAVPGLPCNREIHWGVAIIAATGQRLELCVEEL